MSEDGKKAWENIVESKWHIIYFYSVQLFPPSGRGPTVTSLMPGIFSCSVDD